MLAFRSHFDIFKEASVVGIATSIHFALMTTLHNHAAVFGIDFICRTSVFFFSEISISGIIIIISSSFVIIVLNIIIIILIFYFIITIIIVIIIIIIIIIISIIKPLKSACIFLNGGGIHA